MNYHLICRDLKLDNLLLDGSSPPIVKLCDFGFAKSWKEDEKNLHKFRLQSMRIGTADYMSPEVIKAE